MLGAIIGDIVGSRFEFNPTNDYNFELFGEGCAFTDDTICTVAVADAILRDRDYGESLHEWCRKYPRPKGGYGGRFRQWVMSDTPKPYGSFGNGSAMRVSPIAWWFDLESGMTREAHKSAACTHNHELGCDGAMAVAAAISECRKLRKEMAGKPIDRDRILADGLYHGIYFYMQNPFDFDVKIEEHRNKFDETCQGTVPVAFAIILNSTSFEDAIRQAVSLGADADTLGAIVGSIAEALWGIPEWMKQKAMTYLPAEMRSVVVEFNRRLNVRRRLAQRCKYFTVGAFGYASDAHKEAHDAERDWVDLLAKGDNNRREIKRYMHNAMALHIWQDIADEYDLPLTLVGMIFRDRCVKKEICQAALKRLKKFLDTHYERVTGDRAEALSQKMHCKTMMRWKLALGHMGRFFNGQDPMPPKEKIATPDMLEVVPMEEGNKTVVTDHTIGYITHEMMETLRKGHIPEAQEDHWFMYWDERDNTIHYLRSWTGMEAFVAHLTPHSRGYTVDKLEINQDLCQFGANGDEAGIALFRYLITAETGGDTKTAWDDYLDAWEALNKKYAKK